MDQPHLSRACGKPALVARARELRRNATPCERFVWNALRELRHTHGLHFRRQAPIGPYVADFCCHRLKVIIEADGESHNAEDDEQRDVWFLKAGYRTIRIDNASIRASIDLRRDLLRRLGLGEAAPSTG